jgi:hypothetical protein
MASKADYLRGYLKEYEHQVPLEKDGINQTDLIWCEKYCKKEFGWYFDDNSNAVATFECSKDAMLFTLFRI